MAKGRLKKLFLNVIIERSSDFDIDNMCREREYAVLNIFNYIHIQGVSWLNR